MTATSRPATAAPRSSACSPPTPNIADDREIAADWPRCALPVQEYNGSSPASPVRRTALLHKPFGPDGPTIPSILRRPVRGPGTVVLARDRGQPPTELAGAPSGRRAESQQMPDSARLSRLPRRLMYRPRIIGDRTTSKGCGYRGAPRTRRDRTGPRIHG